MYSFESVISELKKNTGLRFEDDKIGCPSPIPHQGCKGKPECCELCIAQKCKQPLSIHRDYKRFTVLNFRFMISPSNYGGFIHKNDSTLKQLIDLKLIDETKLKPAV